MAGAGAAVSLAGRLLRGIARKAYSAATLLLFLATLPLQWLFLRFSSIGRPEFADPADFAGLAALEAGTPLIQRELERVLLHGEALPNYGELSLESAWLTALENWKSFVLFAYGVEVAENCARCPETARLLRALPGMRSGFFSIMRPGTHLKPHRGNYTGVLRLHLGLRIPDPVACGIRVGKTTRHWREGEAMVFDDTYEHEAWNHSTGWRVVLFIDIVRPLPRPLAAINDAVIWLIGRSSVIQRGKVALREWNRRMAERWPAAGG